MKVVSTILVCAIFSACSSGGSGAALAPAPSTSPGPTPTDFSRLIELRRVASNLQLNQALDLQFDRAGRAYIVEQAGVIQRVDISGDGSQASIFLDIRERVSSGGEMGLLGLALHPEFSNNGQFVVNYTRSNPRETLISRFIGTDAVADAGSEAVLLRVAQPFSNHNAGSLAFGPEDGALYVPLGDGGSGGDPQNLAQNPSRLLGKILRLDIDNPDPGLAYGIPQDNPFFGNEQGIREEIYALGLRNPYKISFDLNSDSGQRLWAADVGQDRFEEVNLIESGANYGWRIVEASACFSPSQGCDTSGLVLPIIEYGRDVGRSITGGYVYRGTQIPELVGYYIFGDFVSGELLAFDTATGSELLRLGNAGFSISSFGQDPQGEIYVLDYAGAVFKLGKRGF